MVLFYGRRLSVRHLLSCILHPETLADPCHPHRCKVSNVAVYDGGLSRPLPLAISVRLEQVLRQRIGSCAITPDFAYQIVDYLFHLDKATGHF